MPTLPESPAWPAIGFRAVAWRPTLSPALLSRAQRERHAGPFEAAVVPPIAALTPRPEPDAAGAADDASAAIARFDAELGADIAPFAALLLRSESAASSQIEHLSSGAKQIALAELGSREKRNATEIVGNVAAMRAALALAEHLDEDAVLAMHRALLQEQDPSIAGRWRTEPVWVGGSAAGPHGAASVAPVHEDVPDLMSDLVSFMRRTDVPLLVQAAVAHAQFETIHPFPDGNGRTGRALVHAMLRGHGLTRSVTVPVSAGLLTDTGTYFDALTAYREGQVTPIVSRLADAAFAAIGNGRRLVTELRELRADWDGRIASRRGSSARRLADLMLRHNVVDSRTIARELEIRIENVGRAVRPLADAGILTEFTGFTRNRMWEARQVSDALDEFAARAGRRRPA